MTIFPHRCFWNVHHVTSQYNQLRCVKQISSMYVPEGKLNTLCINCINCVWTSWAFIYKQQIWLWWGCLFFFCILPRGLGMVCNVDFAHSCGAGAAVASLNIWWGEGERGYEHIIFAAHSSSCRKISFTSLNFKKKGQSNHCNVQSRKVNGVMRPKNSAPNVGKICQNHLWSALSRTDCMI